STSGSRLALAILLAAGTLSTTLPARAVETDWIVKDEATLRDAISSAQKNDTITFTANVTLSANLPTVQKDVTIDGGNFTLSGNNQYRGLFVQSGTVVVNDLTIANAKAQGGRGGDARYGGELYIGGGGGGGGAGLGGALFVASGANVTVSNVNLQANQAHGGNGGALRPDTGGWTSGGGGGYWPTGANGGDAGPVVNGGGGTGGGGDGAHAFERQGHPGGFGGGGGGGPNGGGSGGFGGGAGGNGDIFHSVAVPGGFGGGNSNGKDPSAGGGGGAGLGGAIFVQEGGSLTLAGALNISGNAVAGGDGGVENGCKGLPISPVCGGNPGQGIGSGIFLHGNGSVSTVPSGGQTQTISDIIIDQTGAGGTGADSGSWSLIKNGDGVTVLTGANAYSGGTIVNAGILQGNTSSLQRNITINNNASIFFDQAGSGTYAGIVSGTGNLWKRGNGEVALTGENTYTGGTRVEGGTLLVASDAKLGKADAHLHLLDGGGLHASETFTSSRPVGLLRGNGVLLVDPGKALTLSGVIGGSGVLVKSGSGDLILSGTNTYSGGTTVSAGALLFTTDASLGAAGSAINLNSGTIGLASDASAQTVNRPVTITNSGGFFVASAPLTWSGVISGTGTMVKSGTGTLFLSGNNTYTGATIVDAGTLVANGSILFSSLTVNAGATLGGTGSVGSATLAGGTLSPGNSIGTINIIGNLAFGAGSVYAVEVSGSTADRANATGSADLSGGTVDVTFLAGGSVSRNYTILNATGGLGGTKFASLSDTPLPGFETSLSYDANNVYLVTGTDRTDPELSALNRNQRTVADRALDHFEANGRLPGEFVRLDANGLSAASGEIAAGAIIAGIDSADRFLAVFDGQGEGGPHNA
ncbi:autotransporter-associated beta strand repeat-containing protein, partial [Mesorhizobium sp. B2-1-5]|uniref:autotransporter-associated beta strand repeat-containing protein n=1 Tax=Mesorhizobium sp. B2-1-5 TaxID=2589969 RepID=UPI0011685234